MQSFAFGRNAFQFARPGPAAGGLVTRDAFERIAGSLVGGLSQAMPVDAVYLDLHGAMVSEDFEDGEGEVLRRPSLRTGAADYMLRRYCPPTSNSALVIWPSEQQRTASTSTSNTF